METVMDCFEEFRTIFPIDAIAISEEDMKFIFYAGAIAMGKLHSPILLMAKDDEQMALEKTVALIGEVMQYLAEVKTQYTGGIH